MFSPDFLLLLGAIVTLSKSNATYDRIEKWSKRGVEELKVRSGLWMSGDGREEGISREIFCVGD